MIKFQEVKVGDYLIADNDGDARRGEVTNLNGSEKQVCVDNGIQEFWYETNQLSALPVSDEELKNLQFRSEVQPDGSVKYMKGAFRMVIPRANDFSKMEIWYRDEKRHILTEIPLHVLQNHYYEMTKVHLNTDSFN